MGPVYLAALIVGLGITGAQVLMSGEHGEAHGLGDGTADGVEHGGAEDALAVAHGAGDTEASQQAEGAPGAGLLTVVLSLRFWTFGLLGFGLLGTLAHYLDLASPGVALVLSVLTGVASGTAASLAFRALLDTSVGSGGETRDLLGHVGTVLVPLRRGQRGKVRVEVRGRTLDYLATSDVESLETGDHVLIEEVDGAELRVGRVPPELGE